MKIKIGIFIFLLFITACSTDDITSDQIERQRLLVDIESIKRSSIKQALELSGQLLPKNQVPLVTMMPLEVTSVHVEVGQAVDQGDLLISLSDEEASRQLSQAQNVVEELERSLGQAKELNHSIEQNIGNVKELEQQLQNSINRSQKMIAELNHKDSEGSLVDILQATLEVSLKQAEIAQATSQIGTISPVNTLEIEAQISNAKEAVRQAKQALQATKLTAPIAGVVSQLDVSAGQTALPNHSLAVISDLSQMDATFSVNSFQVAKLSPGLSAELTVTGILETFEAEIARVSPVINPQTNAFTIQIPINNESLQLKGGMRVNATINLNTIYKALVIPAEAVLYENGEPYTFVVHDQLATRHKIELGSRDGDLIEVVSGLEEKDQVVTVGKDRLTDRAEITIRSE
ncbi:efflux RND transporter periplasmic adaptor subunit [Halalkalibacter kiskunsagensis]|uniref:Efflux RND transporter periplasmic adaptor subunit n=1 Tax=Halalkalibacter kiskunsagensis TaxID=1548599 RepID=A0ABV6K8F8_9BACI